MSNKLNNEESSIDPDLQKILDLQEQGYTDEQIRQIMGLDDVEETPEVHMPDIHLNLSDFEYEDPFEAKPPKPSFFKGKDKLKAFRGGKSLKSNMKYTLDGQERYCKKVNLRDVLRLAKKTPAWAMYIGYKTPEMLVDDMTGQYRIMETILALAERAFGDFDIELDQPTDFSLSVLEEVCRLLDLTAKEFGDPVEYLLEQDPEEVFEALSVAIRYNQGFFTKVWNSLGPIKSIFSLISGLISDKIEQIKQIQNLEKIETKLTNSEE